MVENKVHLTYKYHYLPEHGKIFVLPLIYHIYIKLFKKNLKFIYKNNCLKLIICI